MEGSRRGEGENGRGREMEREGGYVTEDTKAEGGWGAM